MMNDVSSEDDAGAQTMAVALLAITSAFLFGVHGHFLRDGVELVVVGFGLLLPYAMAYPMVVLASLNSAHSGQRL